MKKQNRSYTLMERRVTQAIAISAAFFFFFLIASGYQVVWIKVICALFSILIPLLCFAYLYLVQEWRKKRSQWMVAASAALILCTIFSLILHFPSPAP